VPARTWTISLGQAAEQDFSNIVDWTAATFGPRQAERYADLVLAAFDAILDNPLTGQSRARREIGAGLRTLYLARPARHFILYRIEAQTILVLRILHDSMELSRHVLDE
jgi:toxin ParE1/3/4